MMRSIHKKARLLPYVLCIAALAGCGGEEDWDPCAPEVAVPMTVSCSGQEHSVDLNTLAGVNDGEMCLVPLADVVEAANLGKELQELVFDFEALDGFRPSQVECLPLEGSVLESGWMDRATGTLVWDEALQLRGCYSVREVRKILATDDATLVP